MQAICQPPITKNEKTGAAPLRPNATSCRNTGRANRRPLRSPRGPPGGRSVRKRKNGRGIRRD
eukprot:4031322-Lingulodinium_polyedra.AAC.1